MMSFITAHAPMIGLMVCFTIFLGAAVWAYFPSNKMRLKSYGEIPLKEEDHGRE